MAEDFKCCIRDRVTLFNGQMGEIHFMGALEDKDGIFYGIKLDAPNGKNNGTVNGIKYFECEDKYGVFVQPHKIKGSKPSLLNTQLLRVTIEDRVYVKSKSEYGTILFIGNLRNESAKENIVYGIELEEPLGDNDGNINGRQYFHGMEHYCVFCKSSDISMAANDDKHQKDTNVNDDMSHFKNEISIMRQKSVETNFDSDNEEPVPKSPNVSDMKAQSPTDTNETYSEPNTPVKTSKKVAFHTDVKGSSEFENMENFADVDSEYPQIGKTVVIDGGTYNTRVGICGEQTPSFVFDTVTDWTCIKSQKEQPMIYGQINKWEHIQKLWLSSIEEKLKFDSTEHPLIITEAPDISKHNREKVTEMIFEQIQCPAFYTSPSSLFSLFSSGRTSGCVLDFAYDCTRIVPIYEGYVLQLNAMKQKIGGQHISSSLALHLEQHCKVSQMKAFNFEVLEAMKRKHCQFSDEKLKNVKYALPDGKVITITAKALRQSSNVLFHSKKNDLISNVFQSILKCDTHAYSEMFHNVLICGGTSLLRGINEKIQTELSALMQQNKQTNTELLHVTNPKNKQLSAWIGASIFANLESFTRALVTIQEYQECGARIVHHKCF